jgi:hypothetical protein
MNTNRPDAVTGYKRIRGVWPDAFTGIGAYTRAARLPEGEERAMANQLLESGELSARPGTCLLYLVRHGTTTLNVENRYRGRRDIPLDAQGYQDAVDAARCLSDAGLAAVYTSPLRRAIATAQIIVGQWFWLR